MKLRSIVIILFFVGSATAIEDLAAGMFETEMDAIETCNDARWACSNCLTQCPSARDTFYSGMIESPLKTIMLLRLCRKDMSNQRIGMEPWCINNATHFYATDEFNATDTSCKMEPTECATRLYSWARERIDAGEMSVSDSDYYAALKIYAVGAATAEATESEKFYNGQVTKYNRLEQWLEENILVEMDKHLETPDANNTRFSDPVYHNLTAVEEETEERDAYLYRNSLQNAKVENDLIKQDTMEKIKQSIDAILALKNHIASQKELTDQYLAEIKETVVKINAAQERAVDLAYETAHTRGLDDEVASLDRDVLNMFRQLREAQETLNRLVTQVTIEKVRLTFAIKSLAKEIVDAQLKAQCSSKEIFTM